MAAGDIVRAAKGADRSLIESVSVFDVFEGKALGEGKKSIAIAVRVQPRDRTLTEAEIEALAQKLVAAVTKATGASSQLTPSGFAGSRACYATSPASALTRARGEGLDQDALEFSQQFRRGAHLFRQLVEFGAGARIGALMPFGENEFILQRMFQSGQFGDPHFVAMRFQE